MKLKMDFLGFLLLVILQICFLNEKVYSATVPLQKTNLGVYGAKVRDITAYNNGGTTEILIAIDSPKGVYKWTSGVSSSWDAVTDPAIPGESSQIEANLASGYEDDVYAIITEISGGSYTPRMYGSDSGGASGSWVNISSVTIPSSAAGAFSAILLGHSSGMYVATFDGNIYRNTGGVSDTFKLLYSFGSSTEITSISVYDANTFFVIGKSGSISALYKLSISGSSISATSVILPTSSASGGSVEVHLVGVDPANVDTIFLAGSSANPQVYKSVDGGTTWSSSWDYNSTGASNFSGGYPQYIKFNNNRVFISASVLDGTSTTWSHAPNLSSTVGSNTIETHVNDGALEIDPIDSTIIYMGTDWGVGQMTYASSSWTPGSEIGNNDGMEGVMLIDMEFYEYSSTHKELWIGTKSGAGRANYYDPTDPTTTDDSSDWNFPIYPEVDGPPVTEVAIHPADPAIVFIANNAGRVYKTTTGTSTSPTWTKVFQAEDYTSVFGSTRPDHSKITSIQFVPSTPNRMYLSGYNWETGTDGGVYYSDDTGSTWAEDTSISGIPVNTLWVTDLTTWAGVGNSESSETGLRARTSITGAGNWWSPSTGLSLDNEIVNSIAGTTVGDYMTVYVASTGGVYKGTLYIPTSSGFSSWSWTSLTSAIGSTNTNFTSVTLDPNNPDTAYAAVSNCIYETTDGGVTWSVFGSSCVNTHEDVNVLKFDDLIVGTVIGLFSYLPTSSVTPTPTVTPTLSPLPTPSPTPATVGKISGSVVDVQGTAVESVKLTLKGVKTKYSSLILSDADGSFEFTDLKADTYVITAKKKGYKKAKQKVKLGEGEEKTDVKIELRKLKKIHFHRAR
ncbi:MAG TPA: carboxypeptidase regulatory-like domain-containing protein [Candidatus Wunengus sp. YC63]|uniref:carboxypeptidase regulatory-like domain-containing protein n=1 Tax=unclassified Candidatus Wunengus TaxID=3367695 RepID=UPI0040254B58